MQWALGIMMYQMLSGHLPFWDAQSDRSPFAVMSAILNAEVGRPFLLSICRLMRTHDHVPDLPILDAVLVLCQMFSTVHGNA